MNKNRWYVFFLLISISQPGYTMEEGQDPNAHLWHQYGKLLPQLSVIDPCYQNVSKFDGTPYWNLNKQRAYQQAITSDDPLHELEYVAAPWELRIEDVKDAKTVLRKKRLTFPLANLAKAIVLQKSGKSDEAKKEFEIARLRVGYKPHEAPVEYAASSALALQEDNLDDAFRHARKLFDIRCHQPWKSAAAIQLYMLANLNHTLSIIKLAELGFAEWQYRVVQDACEAALIETEAQPSEIFAPFANYIEQLGSVKQLKPYAKAVRRYRFAAEKFSQKEYAASCNALEGLLGATTDDTACKNVQQLGERLLKRNAQSGDWNARCYLANYQLNHKNKKSRKDGIEVAQQLLQDLIENFDEKKETVLLEQGLIATLQRLVEKNNHGTAATLLAQWACSKSFESQDVNGNKVNGVDALQAVKQFAQKGLKGTKKNKELLKAVCAYADAMVSCHQNELSEAQNQLIRFVHSSLDETDFIAQLKSHARIQLVQLADQGFWFAQCWHMKQLLESEDEEKLKKGVALCCQLVERILAHQTQEMHKYAVTVGLYDRLQKIAKTGNVCANYVLSRYQLYKVHKNCQRADMPTDAAKALDDAVAAIAVAVEAKYAGAANFMRALFGYRICLSLIEQKDYEKAEGQLFALLDYNVPDTDKQFFTNFARHQLKACARNGHVKAVDWYTNELLKTFTEQDQQELLNVCNALFGQLHHSNAAEKDEKFWQQLVPPMQSLLKKVETIALHSKNKAHQAQACHLTSLAYVMQVNAKAQYMPGGLEDKLDLFEMAVDFAKQAYQLCEDNPNYKDYYADAQYTLGGHYLARERGKKAAECFAIAADLDHPEAMRTVAQLLLNQPANGERIDEQTFNDNVALLEKAYKAGDKKAGEILVGHYYEGSNKPFGCGRVLQEDATKAYRIAAALDDPSPYIKRIAAYLGYVVKKNNKKKNQIEIAVCIGDLMDAAQKGEVQAYADLATIALEGVSTQKIFSFLELKAKDKIPAVHCALGSIYLQATTLKQVPEAIKQFEKAIEYGQGWRGHYYLTEIYTLERWRQQDLPKAVEHCCSMIDAIYQARALYPQQRKLVEKVLDTLQQKISSGASKLIEHKQRLENKLQELKIPITRKKIVKKADTQEEDPLEGKKVDTREQNSLEGKKAVLDEVVRGAEGKQKVAALKKQLEFYHKTYIPNGNLGKEECKQLFFAIADACDAVKDTKTNAAKLIKKEAARALYQLGLKGYSPACYMYITRNIESPSKELQDKAIDLICRCFTELGDVGDYILTKCLSEQEITKIFNVIKGKVKAQHGQAAYVFCLWHAWQAREAGQSTHKELEKTLDTAFDYCKKAKQWGCKQAVPTWNMLRLHRSKKLKPNAFAQAMNTLEQNAATNIEVAQFLINAYGSKGMKLPCGNTVKLDRKKAKRIALEVKDKSAAAVRALMLFAREDKQYETMLLYGLDLVHRGDWPLCKLAQTCVDFKMYPAKIMDFLESSEDQEFKRVLAGILVAKGEVEHGKKMLDALVADGNVAANFELAFVHADPKFACVDIAKSVYCFSTALKGVPEQRRGGHDVTGCVDKMLTALTIVITDARKHKEKEVEEEAMEAMSMVLKLVNEYKVPMEQVTEQYIARAILYAECVHDYTSAIDSIEQAVGVMDKKSQKDIGSIVSCSQQILNRLNQNQKQVTDENAASKTQRLFNRLVKVLQSIGKDISIGLITNEKKAEGNGKKCMIMNLKDYE